MIAEFNYEGRDYESGEGYWVYLKEGYICDDMECGTIHEANLKDVAKMLKRSHKIEEV